MAEEELAEYLKYLDECNKDFHKALDRINKTTLNDLKSEMKKLKKDKERE